MVLLGLLGVLSLLPWSPTFASYWRALVTAHSPSDLASWGSYAVVLLAFFPAGLAFLAIDHVGWLSRYKIQADAKVTRQQLGKLALNLIINFGITLLLESHLIIGRATAAGRGLTVSPELPAPWVTIATIVGCAMLQEPVFYYSHRLLHVGPLYRHIHKVHHEFHAPIALAAVYAHPLEFGIQNIMPLFVPYLLLRSHLFTFYVGCVLNVLGTQMHHCGYRLPAWAFPFGAPKGPQPNFHDFHHEATHCNFGILGLLDRLHGTDTKWRAAVQARGGQSYVRWSRKRKAVVESPYPVEERAHPKAD